MGIRLRRIAHERPVLSVKRSGSPSPTTGSAKAHEVEQKDCAGAGVHDPGVIVGRTGGRPSLLRAPGKQKAQDQSWAFFIRDDILLRASASQRLPSLPRVPAELSRRPQPVEESALAVVGE